MESLKITFIHLFIQSFSYFQIYLGQGCGGYEAYTGATGYEVRILPDYSMCTYSHTHLHLGQLASIPTIIFQNWEKNRK